MTPRAGKLWIVLIGLCSFVMLGGCATPAPRVPPAPVITGAAECPAPDAPVLPMLDPALPFDAPDNVRALLERDDLCRQYIKGLQATVRCYESQTKDGK